jgi:hypothetical protein
MKICLLEVGPSGPLLNNRENIIQFFKDDYYFVTHDIAHPKAMSFNKGFCWAKNRNYLAKHVPKKYDYYWFTDYDVSYKSMTKLSVYDQVTKDLAKMQPAVMVCHDESKVKNNYGGVRYEGNEYKNIAMSNNQMKIIHADLLDWFFPMPTQFGGVHDCCHYFNVLEIPFLDSVICTFNVKCEGMVSEARSQGGNMQAMHNYIEKAFGPELPKKTTHSFFKYVMQNKVGVMTPQKFTGINDTQIHKFFDANHIIYQTLLRKKC